jgi:hypothetical protein
MAGRVEPHRVMDAGHGDYWGKTDKESKESIRSTAAGHVADALRLGQVARTVASARRPGESADAGARREVGVERFIAAR